MYYLIKVWMRSAKLVHFSLSTLSAWLKEGSFCQPKPLYAASIFTSGCPEGLCASSWQEIEMVLIIDNALVLIRDLR